MRRRLASLVVLGLLAAPAHAEDFGGGWAVPSIDTAMSIGNDVLTREMGLRALGAKPRRAGASTPARAGRLARPQGQSVFSFALEPSGGAPAEPVETGFRRSDAVHRQAQENILRALNERQPSAVPEYKRLFARSDMPRAFEAVTKGYALSADDAADTITAYWVMAWVVANGAPLPAPASVAAARRQVTGGFARTQVGAYDPARRQILADEAIFNFLVLNQAWRNASQGRGASLAELGEATQRNFLPLGADLRSLSLGPNGFARR